ncbi:hypothetical protein HY389_02125 [Candidatus Daviesbacteria bacterium]|nr:hypothetical protein [Candidatus Daviesbacteria bacterium]
MPENQKGSIFIPITAAALLLIATGAFFFITKPKNVVQNPIDKFIASNLNQNQNQSGDPLDLRYAWSQGKCQGQGMVQFGTLPMKPEDFSIYEPYGMVTDAHVTPIDHGYFSPIIFNSPRDTYEVRAIANGTIVGIETRERVIGDQNHNQAKQAEYKVNIEHTCDLYSYFDLLTSLAPDIKAELDKAGGKYFAGRIPIKEGQLIGRIGGQTLDFAVFNNTLKLNFIVPEHYAREPWKIHTDDPFKYFKEPARSILMAKNVRKTEPIAGKIDYDIDGKLIGNWFQKGTNGYQGANQDRYWDGHFALIYDYIDPTQIRFSIGNFNGKAGQFGVKGNAPDPAKVDKSSGLVKYELVAYEYYDKSTGISKRVIEPANELASRNMNNIQGTVLLQLLEDRKLKLEVFLGKSASEVSGFTQNARIYER